LGGTGLLEPVPPGEDCPGFCPSDNGGCFPGVALNAGATSSPARSLYVRAAIGIRRFFVSSVRFVVSRLGEFAGGVNVGQARVNRRDKPGGSYFIC
jgi:hypothetical protein